MCYYVPMSSKDHSTTEWMTQARRGLMELCILTLVGPAARYGYELLTILARWPQLAVSEGTLYPLLHRLEKEGVISAQWREAVAGPPRKYYMLTAAGIQRRDALSAEWIQLTQAMTELQSYLAAGTPTEGTPIDLGDGQPQVGAATAGHEP
jgi:PadR family transcriptional regulator, regulatory protein PadR